MMRKDARELPLAPISSDGIYQRTWVDIQGKQQPFKEYLHWHKINARCKENYQKTRPSYKGYSVSEYFSDYNNFASWCRGTPEFYMIGYSLDKDLLCKKLGLQVYSEDTCVFIPSEINGFLITKKRNVKHFTGVSFQQESQKFIVSCSQLNGKNKTLARVSCPKEGHYLYRKEKVRLAKLLAEEYSEVVDSRVTEMLTNFEEYIDLFTVNPYNKE